MTTQSESARERRTQDHYVYRVNALIEDGQDQLAGQVAIAARRELAETNVAQEPAHP
jgi:hypothetical protein